jgi:hypothetical protein
LRIIGSNVLVLLKQADHFSKQINSRKTGLLLAAGMASCLKESGKVLVEGYFSGQKKCYRSMAGNDMA